MFCVLQRCRPASILINSRSKTYSVIGSGRKCYAKVKTREHTVETDTPVSDGGSAKAAEPVETFLAALIGCEQATAHFVSRMLRLGIDRIDFEVGASRDARGSMTRPVTKDPPVSARLEAVWGTVRVYPSSPDLTADDVRRLGEIVHKRCPIASTLIASGCHFHLDWVIVNKEGSQS